MRELFRRTAPSISRLTLDSPDGKRVVLSVTSEHPFFVEGKGWLEVRRLEKGDRIVSEKNALLAVADIAHDEKPTLVYNFEVAQDHNYFVGDLGAEAHNGTRPLSDPTPTWLYAMYDKITKKFLKWGISIDPWSRYPKDSCEIVPVHRFKNRREAANAERGLEMNHPGPLNHVPWAGKGPGLN